MVDEKLKILVVDDEESNRQILAEIIEDLYCAAYAGNGEDALSLVKIFKPDLVLLDIMMPGMSGLKVAKFIKEENYPAPKIIMLSGKAMTEDRLKGYEVGAEDYIIKPFIDDELLAKVRVFERLIKVENQLSLMNENLEDQVRERTEQLLKTERISVLGGHTARIVHDLRNPLAIIKTITELRLEKNSNEIDFRRIHKASQVIEDRIKSILDVTKLNVNHDSEINVEKIISQSLSKFSLGEFRGKGFEIEKEILHTFSINGHEIHFDHIISNLLRNAAEAMTHAETKKICVKTSDVQDDFVLEVSDMGEGIKKENLEKIFQPFFSTKVHNLNENGSGSGLGLSAIRNMIQSYNGSISVHSESGVGTKFIVKIPAAKKAA
ncbi:MAG: sensor histidine kinase [Oligoflexales bacterium]